MAPSNLVQKCISGKGTTNSKFVGKFKWSHPDWIDIPECLKYIYSCSRGEQFRVCNDIVMDYQKDWFEIISHNNGKSVNKLLDLFKALRIQHTFSRVTRDDRNKKFSRDKQNLRAQALEDLFNMPSTVTETCKIFQETGTKITNCIDKIDTVVDNLSVKFDSVLAQVLVSIQDKFAALKWSFGIIGDWLPKIVLFLAKIFSMGYLLSNSANQNLKSVAAIVALALPSSVDGNLEFISSLIRAIKGVIGNLQAQGESDDSFITSFYTLTKGVISGIFNSVDKHAFDDMNISSKKVKLVTDYIRGATTIVDFLLKVVEKCLGFIGDKILKHYGVMPWFLKEDRIGTLIDRFLEIKEKRLEQLASTNRHAALQIRKLYDDIIKVESDLVKSKNISKENNIKVMPYLRVMIRSLEAVLARIPNHLLSGKDMRRSKPFWIYIYGEPRIGKSAMFQPYLVNLLVYTLGIRTQYEDYTNYTYFRNCGDKYWEKYSDHPVLWYNDLFQNYADEEAMNLIIPELTAVIDDSLYPLNMAFEDKHGVYFNSDIVISNSQLDIVGQGFIANKCLSNGEHLYARRNLVIEFCLNQKYLHSSKVGIDYHKMSDSMKIGPNIGGDRALFPEDMYTLKFHDPLSGSLHSVMNFKDGINYIVDSAKAYRSSQNIFKDKLYNHFKDMWSEPILAQCGENYCNGSCEKLVDAVPCVFCNNFVDVGSYQQHATGCSRQLGHVSSFDIWFDTVSNLTPDQCYENFFAAVMRNTPDLMDTPFMDFVKYSYSQRYQPLVEVLQTANFDIADSDEVQLTKIMVVMEMAAMHNWVQYFEDTRNVTLWKRFKKGFKNVWQSFVSFVTRAINEHPILCYIVFLVTYMTCYISILSMLGCIVPLEAQTAEGKNKAKVKQIQRVKKEKIEKVKAQSYDDQNVIVENKLRDHMCKFVISIRDIEDTKDIDVRYFGSGLCVGSDVFVLPQHYWQRWNELRDFYGTHGNKVVLKLMWGSDKIIDVPWDVIKVWQPDYKHSEDLIFMRITKLIQLTHISKFFVRVDDQPVLFETYLYGLRGENFDCNSISVTNAEYATNVIYTHEGRVEPIYNGKFSERQIHIPLCYRYKNCYTVGGDCGLMLIHADSRLNCRKIMGMHTAGGVKTGLGISSAIFCEDIEEAFQNLYGDDTCITFEDETSKVCDVVIAQSNEYLDLVETGVTVVGYKNYYIDTINGINKKFKITLPRKTKISKSMVYDIMAEDYGNSLVAPARLKPFQDGDMLVSPLYNGLKKIPRCSNMVSSREICLVSEHMFDSLTSWVSPYKDMRILTDFEMVNGYGLLKGMDMTTSAGFPYVVINNTNGKHPYFEVINDSPKQFRMGQIVLQYCCKREDLAKQGIIMETYFLDTLKDEVRDLDKVAIGKTRIFQIAPMDFNMLLRKYFGTFISFCHSTYLEGEMAVGINANSIEWSFMIKQLLANSDSFINGDGKNFDASLGQQYMMEICEIINRMYDDGDECYLIRRTLFATFLNSRHLVGNLVYIARQGNKSGIALTTIFNNLAGMFAIRLAYLRQNNSMYGFFNIVSPKFFGDDDLISVKKESSFLDSLFYQKVWKTLGVDYTAADKTDILKPYYKLAEVTFLQRSFVEDSKYHVYLPQLCYDTIMEIPRWSESDPYNMVDQMNRFNAALLEMSNYEEAQFVRLRSSFVNYVSMLQSMGLHIKLTDLFTYHYAKQLVFPDIYGKKSLNKEQRDLLADFDKNQQMLLFRGGGSE